MSRNLRPLDPNDGPLQAFAHELRGVRQAAGNPTYRSLATVAGFSATTLSDAAGGVRKPTLEVTLAFVGACRGDVELWEKRWYALDRRLADDAGSDARASRRAAESSLLEPSGLDAPSGQAARLEGAPVQPSRVQAPRIVSSVIEPTHADAEELGPVAGASQARITRPEAADGEARSGPRLGLWQARLWWPAMGVAMVLVVTSLFALRQIAMDDASAGCPASASRAGTFPGTTYGGGTRIRSGASRNATVVGQVPAGCTLHFVGFCLGDVVVDATAESPDLRWFELSGGGVVSSAVVHGNPPLELKPVPCPEALPAPSSISLTVSQRSADPDTMELRATGAHVDIVGFAAYFSDNGQSVPAPRWHQLGFTGATADGFAVPWRLAKPAPGQEAVQVAAVACLGGDGPTDVVDVLRLSLAAPTAARPAPLGGSDRIAAERTACQYPTTP